MSYCSLVAHRIALHAEKNVKACLCLRKHSKCVGGNLLSSITPRRKGRSIVHTSTRYERKLKLAGGQKTSNETTTITASATARSAGCRGFVEYPKGEKTSEEGNDTRAAGKPHTMLRTPTIKITAGHSNTY